MSTILTIELSDAEVDEINKTKAQLLEYWALWLRRGASSATAEDLHGAWVMLLGMQLALGLFPIPGERGTNDAARH